MSITTQQQLMKQVFLLILADYMQVQLKPPYNYMNVLRVALTLSFSDHSF